MDTYRFVTADDVARELHISKSKAYKIIQELNKELETKGYMIVRGRVPRKFMEERLYIE